MTQSSEALNESLKQLVGLKVRLASMSYADSDYDEVEEELHDLEDDFINQHGKQLEEALHNVHEKYCPDSDVLLPIAYLGNKYVLAEDGSIQPGRGEGVIVEADEFDDVLCRLVLTPGPVRLVLDIGGKEQRVVWQAS